MSDHDGQLVAEYRTTINSSAKYISAMLIIDNDKIVTADSKTSKIQLYMLEDFELINEITLKHVGWWGITDMTQVDSERFAVLVPGFWTRSDIRIFKLDEEKRMKKVGKFNTSRRSFGLCFQKGFFFVTISPATLFRTSQNSCVKMYSENGESKQVFTVDKENNALFGNHLLKIYVDKNFRMFVCDVEKNELIILKIDSINREVTVLTRHNYLVMDITTKLDGTSFLATSQRDGIVLLHANGGWVFNNFLPCGKLEGKPLAVAFNDKDQQLLVATQRSSWYSPWSTLVFIVYDVKCSYSTDFRVTIEK
ncbi:uncharacterized protein LOC128550130 [Mercenaria mercenaria]|uniref:uncharacterized protein LOC128550130 n=1 Tax=Mercenaria mercenaria TaxID=6596 RepID=UPI00234ED76E|nr:uncharacterized protein LOC128550130 [Mercenaria mercenaria]